MIPLAIPNLTGNESLYLQECIQSTFVSSVGPFVNRFEEMVAKAAGTKYAVSTSSGTTGLHLALTTLGVKQNDLVIIPSFTFIATANAVSHCGASPWIFDISPDTWCLDAELLAETLSKETVQSEKGLIHKTSGRRVAAIMPVHILGMPCDIDPLIEIANRFSLPTVADGAAALGACYKERKLGEFFDCTVYSFNGNKTVTAGGGGIIATNDERLAKLARHLSTTARVGTEYHHDMVGFNYRITNVQAAVGCAQMERIDEFVSKKREIRHRYNENLRNMEGVGLFPDPAWSYNACWFSGLVLPQHYVVSESCEALKVLGIEARSFWKPIHLQPPYEGAPATSQRVAEGLWQRIITLPCSTNLNEHDQDYIISCIKTVLR